MYNFETLLKKNKFPSEGPSTGIKKKISHIRGLEAKIENAKAHLATVKTEKKKLELQNEIQQAEGALQEMDADLCDSINRFAKNQDVYAANSARLAASRAAKAAASATPTPKPDPAPPADPIPDPKPDPKPEPAATKKDTDPVDPKPDPKPADPIPDPKPTEKKKSGSAFGWVAAAVGLVVAVIVGKNIIENR